MATGSSELDRARRQSWPARRQRRTRPSASATATSTPSVHAAMTLARCAPRSTRRSRRDLPPPQIPLGAAGDHAAPSSAMATLVMLAPASASRRPGAAPRGHSQTPPSVVAGHEQRRRATTRGAGRAGVAGELGEAARRRRRRAARRRRAPIANRAPSGDGRTTCTGSARGHHARACADGRPVAHAAVERRRSRSLAVGDALDPVDLVGVAAQHVARHAAAERLLGDAPRRVGIDAARRRASRARRPPRSDRGRAPRAPGAERRAGWCGPRASRAPARRARRRGARALRASSHSSVTTIANASRSRRSPPPIAAAAAGPPPDEPPQLLDACPACGPTPRARRGSAARRRRARPPTGSARSGCLRSARCRRSPRDRRAAPDRACRAAPARRRQITRGDRR